MLRDLTWLWGRGVKRDVKCNTSDIKVSDKDNNISHSNNVNSKDEVDPERFPPDHDNIVNFPLSGEGSIDNYDHPKGKSLYKTDDMRLNNPPYVESRVFDTNTHKLKTISTVQSTDVQNKRKLINSSNKGRFKDNSETKKNNYCTDERSSEINNCENKLNSNSDSILSDHRNFNMNTSLNSSARKRGRPAGPMEWKQCSICKFEYKIKSVIKKHMNEVHGLDIKDEDLDGTRSLENSPNDAINQQSYSSLVDTTTFQDGLDSPGKTSTQGNLPETGKKRGREIKKEDVTTGASGSNANTSQDYSLSPPKKIVKNEMGEDEEDEDYLCASIAESLEKDHKKKTEREKLINERSTSVNPDNNPFVDTVTQPDVSNNSQGVNLVPEDDSGEARIKMENEIIAGLEKQLASMSNSLEAALLSETELNGRVATLKRHIEALKEDVDARETRIKVLSGIVESKDECIIDLNNKTKGFKQQIEELKNEIEKGQKIAKNCVELHGSAGDSSSKQSSKVKSKSPVINQELSDLHKKIDQLQTDVKRARDVAAENEKRSMQYLDTINQLRGEVARWKRKVPCEDRACKGNKDGDTCPFQHKPRGNIKRKNDDSVEVIGEENGDNGASGSGTSKNKKTTKNKRECFHLKRGYCKKGNSCDFSHNISKKPRVDQQEIIEIDKNDENKKEEQGEELSNDAIVELPEPCNVVGDDYVQKKVPTGSSTPRVSFAKTGSVAPGHQPPTKPSREGSSASSSVSNSNSNSNSMDAKTSMASGGPKPFGPYKVRPPFGTHDQRGGYEELNRRMDYYMGEREDRNQRRYERRDTPSPGFTDNTPDLPDYSEETSGESPSYAPPSYSPSFSPSYSPLYDGSRQNDDSNGPDILGAHNNFGIKPENSTNQDFQRRGPPLLQNNYNNNPEGKVPWSNEAHHPQYRQDHLQQVDPQQALREREEHQRRMYELRVAEELRFMRNKQEEEMRRLQRELMEQKGKIDMENEMHRRRLEQQHRENFDLNNHMFRK